jgi:hypothetical protein
MERFLQWIRLSPNRLCGAVFPAETPGMGLFAACSEIVKQVENKQVCQVPGELVRILAGSGRF